MLIAYYMCDDVKDPQAENRREGNSTATAEDLAALNVIYTHIPVENPNWEEELKKLGVKYDMHYRDEVDISRQKMPDLDKKLEHFFEEHLHTDPEVRFIKSGKGFFDVRDKKDQWIRIVVKAGDFLYLPAGIYHRFATDKTEAVCAIRLFSSTPKWDPHNRSEHTEKMDERQTYVKGIGAH